MPVQKIAPGEGLKNDAEKQGKGAKRLTVQAVYSILEHGRP